VKRMPLSNHVW